MYNWISLYSKPKAGTQPDREMNHPFDEIKRLKKELAQVTQERDILKKATVSLSGQSNNLVQFISGSKKTQCFSWPCI